MENINKTQTTAETLVSVLELKNSILIIDNKSIKNSIHKLIDELKQLDSANIKINNKYIVKQLENILKGE